MNKIKYSFLLLTTLTMTLWSHLGSAQEKGTRFENITLEEALAKATKKEKAGGKSPKLIFVDCYTSWCGPCKKMASQVFPLSING